MNRSPRSSLPVNVPRPTPDGGRELFPLAALVGQEAMRRALFLLAVDPNLGGLLIMGEKGTAKSTAARGLAEILPPIWAFRDCPYHCQPDEPASACPDCRSKAQSHRSGPSAMLATPFLTLPLGATEDRVVGGLDLEASIREGCPELKPGLLGLANRGFLYVDEINLLEPFLAHLLLDAAESGRLGVEREGLSTWHPARVTLIGTMNPEEGTVGPQLQDRLALIVEVSGAKDAGIRAEIVRRRLAFEADPRAFRARWARVTAALAARVARSRALLPTVDFTDTARNLVATLAREAGVNSHRADLSLARAARAWAAWENGCLVGEEAVRVVAPLVLDSRTDRVPRKSASITPTEFPEFKTVVPLEQLPYFFSAAPDFHIAGAGRSILDEGPPVWRYDAPDSTFDLITPVIRRDQGPKGRSGRRASRRTQEARGRYYRSSPEILGRPLALDATFRAAAPHQIHRRGTVPGLVITRQDVREKVYRHKTGRLVLFLVDASGSIGSFRRMAEAKAAAMSLLREAYQKRDRVGLIGFHGTEAELLLPPTNSVELANRLLAELPTGGKTPLAAALVLASRVLRLELARDPHLTPLVVLMTDGRPNVPLFSGRDPWPEALELARGLAGDRRLRFLLVDTDNGHYADYKLTTDLARCLEAPRLTLEDLRAGRLEAWLAALN